MPIHVRAPGELAPVAGRGQAAIITKRKSVVRMLVDPSPAPHRSFAAVSYDHGVRRLTLAFLAAGLLSCHGNTSPQPDSGQPENASEWRGVATTPALPSEGPVNDPAPATPPVAAHPVSSTPLRDDSPLDASPTDVKMLLKQQLEQRVYSGRATDTEIHLLISTCKDLGDKLCVAKAQQIEAHREGSR